MTSLAVPVFPLWGINGGCSNTRSVNSQNGGINIKGDGNHVIIVGDRNRDNNCQQQQKTALLMQYMTRIMSQFMRMFEQLFGQLANGNQGDCGCGCGYSGSSVYACPSGGWDI